MRSQGSSTQTFVPSYIERYDFQLHDDLSLIIGNSLAAGAPFIKVKDSLQNHPGFVHVVLRHENGRVSVPAEVLLDSSGDALSTGIFLPYRLVQKLQLDPLHHTEEFEGWRGGTATLMQYTSVWVSEHYYRYSSKRCRRFHLRVFVTRSYQSRYRYRSLQDLKTAGLDGFLA